MNICTAFEVDQEVYWIDTETWDQATVGQGRVREITVDNHGVWYTVGVDDTYTNTRTFSGSQLYSSKDLMRKDILTHRCEVFRTALKAAEQELEEVNARLKKGEEK